MALFIRLLICIFIGCATLSFYIEKLNELTELRLQIPLLSKEVKEIQEKNLELSYEISQFESPVFLIQLARKPQFSHLKYPLTTEVVCLPEKLDP